MVRESPNPENAVPGRTDTRRSPVRRALAVLVAITIIAMLWGGLTGYIFVVLLGAIIIVSALVYWVAAAAAAPKP